MRSISSRARERDSNRRALSLSTSAPASIRCAATWWVRAVVLAKRKQPVSVAMPVYRQSAMDASIGTPMSEMTPAMTSQAAAAPGSSSVS